MKTILLITGFIIGWFASSYEPIPEIEEEFRYNSLTNWEDKRDTTGIKPWEKY